VDLWEKGVLGNDNRSAEAIRSQYYDNRVTGQGGESRSGVHWLVLRESAGRLVQDNE